jgi:hypothetical protein
MKIFVSYRSVNRALVNQLVTDLADMGHEVWYDQEVEGGQIWWDNILTHIRWCDLLVFALTPHSIESYPCQLEYSYANAVRRHIIPVLLVDGVNYNLLPVVLQERQIINYTERNIDSYKRLASAIRNLAPVPALPDPLPEAPPLPISPLAQVKSQIDNPALEYEQQLALLHQLKSYLQNPDYDGDARLLLERLSEHPMLRASVLRDIEAALKTPAVSRHSTKELRLELDNLFSDLEQQAPPADPAPSSAQPAQAAVAQPSAPPLQDETTAPPIPVAAPAFELDEGETIVKKFDINFNTVGAGGAGLISGLFTYGVGTVATAVARNAAKRELWLTDKRMVFCARTTTEQHIVVPYDQIAEIKKISKLTDPSIQLKTKAGVEYNFSLVAGAGFLYGNRDELLNTVHRLSSGRL